MRSMTIRCLLIRILAAACIVGGSVLWKSRLEYSPEGALQGNGHLEIASIDSKSTSSLEGACNIGARKGGWILFFISASLLSDNVARGVFETAINEQGLFLDYNPEDSALLRAGLTSSGVTKFVPVRTVRRDEDIFIAIGVRYMGIRVVTNAVDRVFQWPDFRIQQLRCDAVTPGLSDEIACERCEVEVRYVIGSGESEFNEIMNSLSNRRRYEAKRWSGSLVIVVSLVFSLILPKWLRDRSRNF